MVSTMRQAHITTDGSVEIHDVRIPTPQKGEVLLRTGMVGICGSDTHAIAGGHPFLCPPYVPGHEATGTVSAIGANVDDSLLNKRVILKPNLACGSCENCRRGRTNACQELQWIGCDPSGKHPGAMAEYVIAPAKNVYPIPSDISDEAAVLIECLATPVHAVSQADDLTNSRVVIIGAGTIGFLTLVACQDAGATNIVVVDLDDFKLERALRQGAHTVVKSSENTPSEVVEALGGPADVVFDCVAHESTVDEAMAMLRRAGSLMIVGVPPSSFPINMPRIQDWEIRIQGCAAYTEKDIHKSIQIAANHKLPDDVIVTAQYPLESASEAFAEAKNNSSGKVLVYC